jgi:hypothetical protein
MVRGDYGLTNGNSACVHHFTGSALNGPHTNNNADGQWKVGWLSHYIGIGGDSNKEAKINNGNSDVVI